MSISYEVVRGRRVPQDGDPLSCAMTSEAVRYVGPADWIVAVENGTMRELTPAEEAEFQSALGHDPSWHPGIYSAHPSEPDYEELKARLERICEVVGKRADESAQRATKRSMKATAQ